MEINGDDGSGTNFSSLSNDAICIIKAVAQNISLPRVNTLPCFLL